MGREVAPLLGLVKSIPVKICSPLFSELDIFG